MLDGFLLGLEIIVALYCCVQKSVVCVPDWKFWSSVATKSLSANSNYPFDKVWIYDPDVSGNATQKLSQPSKKNVHELQSLQFIENTPKFEHFENLTNLKQIKKMKNWKLETNQKFENLKNVK